MFLRFVRGRTIIFIISGVDKLVPTKDMSRSAIKKLAEGNEFYSKGIDLMKEKNYSGAIDKFTLARNSYKRAKISEHDYNYININLALCYANSGKEENFGSVMLSSKESASNGGQAPPTSQLTTFFSKFESMLMHWIVCSSTVKE